MRCVAWCIPRGVSYVRVSQRRLAMPLQDMDLRHATLLFCAEGVGPRKGKARGNETKNGR